MVKQGATAAIGFEKTIFCDEANEWTKHVYGELLSGKKLKDAVKDACEEFSEESSIQSVVICGDENVKLY